MSIVTKELVLLLSLFLIAAMLQYFAFNFAISAGILTVTSYGMGTLYERKQAMTNDIRDSISGLLAVLQHFIENEKYIQG
jgi:hypothetical protein